jgi:aryl-alcohol dehydrogenase-like predicted oxidoreductase
MRYKTVANIETSIDVSVIGLGGHEFLPDGRSRGFNDNFALATEPGYIFEGFGKTERRTLFTSALEQGINFFDVTQDSEKEALGRNIKEVSLPFDIYIQTRPEGMVYTYDKNNVKMADLALLRTEVQRILTLIGRDYLDFLNVAFMQSALNNDFDYLDKIAYNIETLKKEGLIRFATADTFSGEKTYLRQIESGIFDSLFINFNLADCGAERHVLPTAARDGIAFIAREPFMKGTLFKMGEEAGYSDRGLLARTALSWCLSFEEITSVVMGVSNEQQLLDNLTVLASPGVNEEENAIIEALKQTEAYNTYFNEKQNAFFA